MISRDCHTLHLQAEVLEALLLYYKDYVHRPANLVQAAQLFQVFPLCAAGAMADSLSPSPSFPQTLGFGLQQQSRVAMVPASKPLLEHLR